MGICWYCHWGWPKQVRDIYDKYLALTSETAMHYGPAHIVWDDENFDKQEHVQWCIDTAEDWWEEWAKDKLTKLTRKEFELVIDSLRELLLVPDEILNCCPADYDDEHPEKYPPPTNLEMVRGV